MSGFTEISVTPSTSLVLLKPLTKPVIVYLPKLTAPDFSVTVRDTTGFSTLLTTPVRISTIQGARFFDGTSLYLLNQPYGLVNLSLRNSSFWQINHTSGQSPATAAADIGVLSTGLTTFGLVSTSQKQVSTLLVESFATSNSISVTGPFIVTNLSTPGFVLFRDRFTVYNDSLLRGGLVVSGATQIVSSFFVETLQPVSSLVSVSSSVQVGGSLSVGSELVLASTLRLTSTVQIETLQTTVSTALETARILGPLELAGVLSTLGNLISHRTTSVTGDALLTREVSTTGGLVSSSNLVVGTSVLVEGFVSTLSTTQFASSLRVQRSLIGLAGLSFSSTLGVGQLFLPSSLSTVGLSSFASLSTSTLEITSTLSVNGTLSTGAAQSYQYFSIGGSLVTQAAISSLGQTVFGGAVSVLGPGTFLSLSTLSSVGVGGECDVLGSATADSATLRGPVLVGTTLRASTVTDILGDLIVRSNGTIKDRLTVLGGSEISNFLVKSFLLSNLQIVKSTPFLSFEVSSLSVSSLQTAFLRVSTASLTVSSVYGSSLQAGGATANKAQFVSLDSGSLSVGDTSSLDQASKPMVTIGTKANFADGLSTIAIRAGEIQASQYVGSLVGTASYLSNVTIPFFMISGITVSLSSLTADEFYTSSFVASTFVTKKSLVVFSTVITPSLVLEGQGYTPRFDVNQMLALSPTSMVINRSLYFDRTTNRVGLFVSTPAFDFDISGLVYASNIFYSSINPIYVSSSATRIFSTLLASSIFVRDSVQFGAYGVEINAPLRNGSTSFTLGTTSGSFSNLFGIYTAREQSTILLNAGVHIYADRKVALNGCDPITGAFLAPITDFQVTATMRTESLFTSSTAVTETAQTLSYLTPFLVINCNTSDLVNTLSTSFDALTLNRLVTIQTATDVANRYLGIDTLHPQCCIDVRGNAYFSSVQTLERFHSDSVAIASVEM
jgi:hypothetical protein